MLKDYPKVGAAQSSRISGEFFWDEEKQEYFSF
jgi:hypothetical protein